MTDLLPVRRVGFLFNHEQVHQIAHSAPIAFELSRSYREFAVVLLFSSEKQRAALETLARAYPGHRCEFLALRAEGRFAWLEGAPKTFALLRNLALLRTNAQTFSGFDAIVTPEKTSLAIRNLAGCAGLKLVHTRHGAGDREIGFDAQSREFDLVLLPGEKIRRRLAAAGALAPQHAIVGYAKFDVGATPAANRRKLFDDDKPTVLYNPHCSPHLSSWYAQGREILDFFRASGRYNLIFAPHVMLFQRRLQVSIDKLAFKWVRNLESKYLASDNIHVDLGSSACTDMTYTRAADLYLGDVSSQVCEFLLNPRPCVFVNTHRIRWRDDPNYSAWSLGSVFERVEELPGALESAFRGHAEFRGAQEAYVRDTFDLSETPSAQRAAEAIRGFLAQAPQLAGRGERFEPAGRIAERSFHG